MLNLFFVVQLLTSFYMFQEMSRMKNEILVLNQNLILKTQQVVQLTSLIERHVVSSPGVDPTHAFWYNNPWIVGGVACVATLTISFLVVVYYTPNYSLAGAVTSITNWFRPPLEFLDEGRNQIQVVYDLGRGNYVISIKSRLTGDAPIPYPDMTILVEALSQINNRDPVPRIICDQLSAAARASLPPNADFSALLQSGSQAALDVISNFPPGAPFPPV